MIPLLIAVIAGLASIRFHRVTKAKGYPTLRSTLYPLMLGAFIIIFGQFFIVVINRQTSSASASAESTINYFALGMNALSLAFFFWGLRKAWKTLASLPPKNSER